MVTETASNNNSKKKRAKTKWPAWHAEMARYRAPSARKASWQLANTLIPYCGLWVLMVASVRLGYPYVITLLLACVSALFLVRLFVLFHDCVPESQTTTSSPASMPFQRSDRNPPSQCARAAPAST